MVRTFPASLDKLYEMLRFVNEQVQSTGFDVDQSSKIELAIEEALVNIISYGYPSRRGIVEIECNQSDPQAMVIVLLDHGIPYNPLSCTTLADPDAPIELQTIGGYGILLIKKLMDHVDYRRENNCNVLTLVKKRL